MNEQINKGTYSGGGYFIPDSNGNLIEVHENETNLEAMRHVVHKYLTEAMGYENIHIDKYDGTVYARLPGEEGRYSITGKDGFFTWGGFGKLLEWSQQQEWWIELKVWLTVKLGYNMDVEFARTVGCSFPEEFINPSRFATAIYNFLKEREK